MSKYQFPPLKDEKEFESLVNDLCIHNYGIDFQIYGRKGQKQSGIDGLSFSKDKKQIVFQCKNKFINRDDKKIQNELLKDIEVEVKSAITELTNIDTFIFANSFKQDTVLQHKATNLSSQYNFTVIVWSWEEIEGLLEKYLNVAKQYYPEIFDKNILSIDDIKQRFQENSSILLSSESLYIGNSFIETPEIDKINDFIKSEDFKDNLLVLTGKAGIGKTAILSKIQSNLIENQTAYLSIKSDKFDIETKDIFSKFFGVEDILHSIKQLARKEKVVVLIDQLDALSLTMSSNKKVINIILEFIEKLKYISNVKTIVSIREYDLKNDPLFKSLDEANIINTQLLSFDYVNIKLKSFIKESEKSSNTLIELLRTPLHLSIFIELYPNDNSCISIKTLQDLYNKFWEQKIQDKNIDNATRKNMIELLYLLVLKMDEMKKIEISKFQFEDEFEDELSLLFSQGILKEENNKISFFHQTFYDYVFARNFVQKNTSLYEYILTTTQDLGIREQFKQIIQFLRGTDEEKYLLELENILYSDKIRFHLKLLLMSYLGSLENPTNEEFTFIQKLFKDKENYEKYFIESWISSDWLIYFKDIDFFNSENFKKYDLHFKLKTFVNKETNLVLEILDNCTCDLEIKNQAIIHSLHGLDRWNNYSFQIFQKYHYLIYEYNMMEYGIQGLYKKVYLIDKDYAIDLFFNFLDIQIKEVGNDVEKELLRHNWYEIFKFLITEKKIIIFQRLLESIQKIGEKLIHKCSEEEFLITDMVRWESYNLNQNSYGLYKETLKKVSLLALENKSDFLALIKPYQDTKHISLVIFLVFGYLKNPNEYKDGILILLTNIKLLEEIVLDDDNGYELAILLHKSFNLFTQAEQEKIFNTIVQVNPKWQNSSFLGKWDKKPVFLGTLKGLQKYELLSRLDIKDIKKFGYFKEFQELQRKFDWYKFKKPYKTNCGFVGAPLTQDAYSKMNLNSWLQLMKVSNRSKSSSSGEFEKKVTENPDSFFNFLLQIKSEDIHPDYYSAGLKGLMASNYDEEKILEIIHLYSDTNSSLLQRTVLDGIKHLIDKDRFDKSLIDILEANKDIRHESLRRDKDKFLSIYDHMSSSINSYEGNFAELLPHLYNSIYNDEDSKKRVSNLINEVIDKNIDFVIFGLLRSINKIELVDKQLFAKLLMSLIKKDEVGQVSMYSLQNFHYLYANKLVSKEQLIVCAINCISFLKLLQGKEEARYIKILGMFLFYYSLVENNEIFEDLLNEGIDLNKQVIHGVLHQIFEQELHSKDEIKIRKSKQLILKFKNDEENNNFYTLDLAKMNGLKFIQDDFEFVKDLASSLHIKIEVDSFIEYLQNEYHADTSIAEKIFELLEELIQNIDSVKDVVYYNSGLLMEFILELNTRAKSDDKKVDILNLIDKFLLSDRLRFNTKSAIE